MLSEENKEKIFLKGIYKALPDKNLMVWYGNDPYHCKNWTFTVEIIDDEIMMVDTYFKDECILVTDDNIEKFHLIYDLEQYKRIDHPEIYDDEDVTERVPIDSGGSWSGAHFVKMTAKVSKKKLLEKYNYDLASAVSRVDYLKKEIELMESGTHYLLNK